jgi:hypothetical protein
VIEVMLVIMTLKTGLVMTHSLTAPNWRQCETARPLIEADYRRQYPDAVRVKTICLEIAS